MPDLNDIARIHYPGVWNVNGGKLDWIEIPDNPSNWIKILVIDEANHRVDFLFKQDPFKHFSKHRHLCAVSTLTLEGEWGYYEGDEKLFAGCYAYETAGTTHTPYATENGMTVLACFQGTSPTFLELLDEHDEVTAQVTIDYYKQFYDGP